jgi:hypothetical protein
MASRYRRQRWAAAPLASVIAASAFLAGVHTHAWLADDLAAEAAHVPLSVIADPDAPAPEEHWHSGTTVEQDPCIACLLCHQPAFFGHAFVVARFVYAARITLACGQALVPVQSNSPSARAPPFTC